MEVDTRFAIWIFNCATAKESNHHSDSDGIRLRVSLRLRRIWLHPIDVDEDVLVLGSAPIFFRSMNMPFPVSPTVITPALSIVIPFFSHSSANSAVESEFSECKPSPGIRLRRPDQREPRRWPSLVDRGRSAEVVLRPDVSWVQLPPFPDSVAAAEDICGSSWGGVGAGSTPSVTQECRVLIMRLSRRDHCVVRHHW